MVGHIPHNRSCLLQYAVSCPTLFCMSIAYVPIALRLFGMPCMPSEQHSAAARGNHSRSRPSPRRTSSRDSWLPSVKDRTLSRHYCGHQIDAVAPGEACAEASVLRFFLPSQSTVGAEISRVAEVKVPVSSRDAVVVWRFRSIRFGRSRTGGCML